MFSNCANCLLSISLSDYLHIADRLNCTYGCSSIRLLDLVPTLHYQIDSFNMCSLLKISHADFSMWSLLTIHWQFDFIISVDIQFDSLICAHCWTSVSLLDSAYSAEGQSTKLDIHVITPPSRANPQSSPTLYNQRYPTSLTMDGTWNNPFTTTNSPAVRRLILKILLGLGESGTHAHSHTRTHARTHTHTQSLSYLPNNGLLPDWKSTLPLSRTVSSQLSYMAISGDSPISWCSSLWYNQEQEYNQS